MKDWDSVKGCCLLCAPYSFYPRSQSPEERRHDDCLQLEIGRLEKLGVRGGSYRLSASWSRNQPSTSPGRHD